MGRIRVAVLVAAAAIVLAGCSSGRGNSSSEAVCTRAGEASVCVGTDSGTAYEVTGTGFRPGSEVGLDVATGAGRMIPVDGDGRFPPANGTLGFLPGPQAEVHHIEGVDASGRPVAFTVTCSLDEAKQPHCGF